VPKQDLRGRAIQPDNESLHFVSFEIPKIFASGRQACQSLKTWSPESLSQVSTQLCHKSFRTTRDKRLRTKPSGSHKYYRWSGSSWW